MALNLDILALQIGERIREKGTRQGRIPFLTGDLRKSISVSLVGHGAVAVGSNLSYARAVHDGRPAITIRPKKKKFLHWSNNGQHFFAKKVNQPARKGKPFLREAVEEMQSEGYGFLMPELTRQIGDELAKTFAGRINIDVKI